MSIGFILFLIGAFGSAFMLGVLAEHKVVSWRSRFQSVELIAVRSFAKDAERALAELQRQINELDEEASRRRQTVAEMLGIDCGEPPLPPPWWKLEELLAARLSDEGKTGGAA